MIPDSVILLGLDLTACPLVRRNTPRAVRLLEQAKFTRLASRSNSCKSDNKGR